MANFYLQRLETRIVKGIIRRGRQKNPPFSVNVEPTNVCNLACPICPHGAAKAGLIPPLNRKKGMMSLETFAKVLEGTKSHIREMALYLHGEPFLNPELVKMVRAAGEHKMKVVLYTNGLILTEEKLREIFRAEPATLSASMDLVSRRCFDKYKAEGLYDQAVEKLKLIISVFEQEKARNSKLKTRLSLRSIYDGETKDETMSFLDHWFSHNAVKSIQLTTPFPWPRRKDADFLTKHMTEDRRALCRQLFNALNILWDGSVTPCSFDYDGEYIIGDIHRAPLDVILNSPEARRFRRLHLLGRRNRIPLCRDCMLPRYSFAVITMHRGRYLKLKPEERDDLFRRISALHYHPRQDFES